MKKDFTIPAVLLFFVGVPVLAHLPSDYDTAKAEADSVQTIYRQNKEKTLSLPEEMQEARPGDILKIEKVDDDSIYIGFSHEEKTNEFRRSPEDRDVYTPDIDSTNVSQLTDRY